jgi:hypothetical protein
MQVKNVVSDRLIRQSDVLSKVFLSVRTTVRCASHQDNYSESQLNPYPAMRAKTD